MSTVKPVPTSCTTKCSTILMPNLTYASAFQSLDMFEAGCRVTDVHRFTQQIYSLHREKAPHRTLPTFEAFVKGRPQFFTDTLPTIISHALKFDSLFLKPIEPLGPNQAAYFTEAQVACLLSNAFLCAFEGRDHHGDFPIFSFFRLFSEGVEQYKIEKLKMLMAYFESLDDIKDNVITVKRGKVSDLEFNKDQKMCPFVNDVEQKMNEVPSANIISSSNKLLGGAPGGVLATGKMQEPVDFATHPEMIVALLVCSAMEQNEAVSISGVAEFTTNQDFGIELKLASVTTPLHRRETRKQTWINVDSVDFRKQQAGFEFSDTCHERQLLKLFAGMKLTDASLPVLSGVWGGDAFGGNDELIFVQMWLAASMCSAKEFKWLPSSYPCGSLTSQPFPSQHLTIGQVQRTLEAYLRCPGERSLFQMLNLV